uniref:Phosphatidylinositol-glycan biosynthesis class W protein n=1 Tax=Macrostomum lignano TaxID=282301 RepID=A0A1I8I985_9PLAT
YAVPVAVSAVVALAVNVAALARLLARRRRGQWLWWLPAELGEPAFSAEQAGRARFITEFRGLIYLPTCACILARDLPCFRLPFGKTRTFGTGLMDVGLGCFVFLMGLTAPTCRARALNRHQRQAALLKQTVLCLLLTGCGLVRLVVAPDQAVEEYGRDWNVFFTLAAVKMVGSATELLLLPPQSRLPPALPACLLLAAYEVALGPVGRLAITIVRPESAADAEAPAAAAAAALAARRDAGFFEANREGLVACLGLYCLYLLALQVGRLALPVLASRRPTDVGRVTGWCAAVAAATLALRVLPAAGLALPESRRLGNAAYVAWILGFCCAYMAACAFASCLFAALAGPYPVSSNNVHLREHHREHQSEHLSQPPPPPASPFLQLVDQHGLAYFLIGNLLTGLTGRCILPALYGRPDFGPVMPPAACAPVLMAYMLGVKSGDLKILSSLVFSRENFFHSKLASDSTRLCECFRAEFGHHSTSIKYIRMHPNSSNMPIPIRLNHPPHSPFFTSLRLYPLLLAVFSAANRNPAGVRGGTAASVNIRAAGPVARPVFAREAPVAVLAGVRVPPPAEPDAVGVRLSAAPALLLF